MLTLLKVLFALALQQAGLPNRPFLDQTHVSQVFGEPRNYRILLPPNYTSSGKSYPVIYFFHGHSDRYTLEHYDGGADFIPKMVDYVARHDVIVVLVDGYVAKDYTGFYGGTPWDIRFEGGTHDFGPYFEELVAHIDSAYRTLSDRRHRATSGLSMGGFMSLWLSARLPDRIGSASAFNPGPDLQEQKGLERTSLVRLSPATRAGTAIPLVLSTESWSYHFTPDVRYGKEPLYQAFQLHARQINRFVLRASRPPAP